MNGPNLASPGWCGPGESPAKAATAFDLLVDLLARSPDGTQELDAETLRAMMFEPIGPISGVDCRVFDVVIAGVVESIAARRAARLPEPFAGA